MKMLKGSAWWAIIIGLLLFANLGWMSWNLYQHSDIRAAATQFKIEVLHTNDVSGIGIVRIKTDQLIWAEWDFNHKGIPNEESYFFCGTNIFNLYLHENQSPEYDVVFHGTEKSKTTWLDKGSGAFVEKIFDNTNGVASRVQVWYNEAWHTIENENGKRAISVNGQWLRPKFTNGLWTIEAP